MIKNLLTYLLVIGFLFFLGLEIHSYFIEEQNFRLGFSLKKLYSFHAIFTLVVLVKFNILSGFKKVSEQLGFIYLGVLILKIIFFCIVFYNPVFTSEKLTQIERISLLIPMVIFLISEVYFVSKLIQKK